MAEPARLCGCWAPWHPDKNRLAVYRPQSSRIRESTQVLQELGALPLLRLRYFSHGAPLPGKPGRTSVPSRGHREQVAPAPCPRRGPCAPGKFRQGAALRFWRRCAGPAQGLQDAGRVHPVTNLFYDRSSALPYYASIKSVFTSIILPAHI